MSDESQLKNVIEILGLTLVHGKILIELMKMGGESTAPDLYEKLGKNEIKLISIYYRLEKLINNGLVLESDQEGEQKKKFMDYLTALRIN